MKTLLQILLLVNTCLLFTAASAQEKTEDLRMNGAEILASLSGKKFIGKDNSFEQSFGDLSKTPEDQNGVSTTYSDGHRPSYGRWRVTNNQYCSLWPPNSGWACYDMAKFKRSDKDWVVWIASNGTRYEAHLK